MASKVKSFKDYYNENPEFRRKHLEKLKAKVVCECGFVTALSNLYTHKKGRIHKNMMDSKDKNNDKKLEIIDKIKELQSQLQDYEASLK